VVLIRAFVNEVELAAVELRLKRHPRRAAWMDLYKLRKASKYVTI
jgi:hypothetical protein